MVTILIDVSPDMSRIQTNMLNPVGMTITFCLFHV